MNLVFDSLDDLLCAHRSLIIAEVNAGRCNTKSDWNHAHKMQESFEKEMVKFRSLIKSER